MYPVVLRMLRIADGFEELGIPVRTAAALGRAGALASETARDLAGRGLDRQLVLYLDQ